VVDTRGLPLLVMVTPADLHDFAAAKEVLFRLRLMHPEITIVWADGAYADKLVTWAKQHLNLTVKPVSRPQGRLRLRHPAPPPGCREVARVDDARPPPHLRLRRPAASRRFHHRSTGPRSRTVIGWGNQAN
ncbi:transposase, partial [Streptomyces sp. NPDC001840]